MYDEENTEWPIDLLIRTGGGDLQTGQAQGIHWHMNIQSVVEYISRDDERQDIPWVRMTDRQNGRVVTYQNQDNPLTDEEIASAEIRTMDCMDCHNRPSHIYNSPDHAIDMAILANKIDRTLPSIKDISVTAMSGEYTTEDEAWHAIATEMSDFYELKHPEINATKQAQILESIEAVQTAFSQNIFPEMKVNWEAYPGNLGHFISPGCMRCHVEAMVGDKGQQMTTDCKTCHSILSQGAGDNLEMASNAEGLDFKHPEDIDEAWTEMGCYECHSGVQP
jgi:ribosomal protein S27E